MKALLMHADRDFDLQQKLPRHEPELTQDLELDTLLQAMAGEDEFLRKVARTAMLSGVENDVRTILHRQDILRDCLQHPAEIRELYAIAVAAITARKRYYFGILSFSLTSILYGAVEIMHMLTDKLRQLKAIADADAGRFKSQGLVSLFAMLRQEFSDDYFAEIEDHLAELRFRSGVSMNAELGPGNEGASYSLRRPRGKRSHWLARLRAGRPAGYSFRIADRDEAGARILAEMADRGIRLVANALAQSSDHVLSFFDMLQTELAFYIGCLNLRDALAPKGLPMTFPRPEPAGARCGAFHNLHDVCLALTMEQPVVGNSLDARGKSLAIVTGANQGGKSSFLRSVGVAQLMMQCGMFVVADSFAGELCTGLFTHYKREEDTTMQRGKLDEELFRMSAIVDAIRPNSLLLFNESFASTNEREGSEIARQIVTALLERHVRIVFVTHLYEFAHGQFESQAENAIFLRAERRADGTRTFRIVAGEPLKTSYGEDLYRTIFAIEPPHVELDAVEDRS